MQEGAIRKAKPKDAVAIHELINFYAKEGLLLPVSLNNLYDNIRDFWVYEQKGRFWGVAPSTSPGKIWRKSAVWR